MSFLSISQGISKMEKRIRLDSEHNDSRDAIRNEQSVPRTKHFCQSRDTEFLESNDQQTQMEVAITQAHPEDSTSSTFSIRGEDLNLLGESLASVDQCELFALEGDVLSSDRESVADGVIDDIPFENVTSRVTMDISGSHVNGSGNHVSEGQPTQQSEHRDEEYRIENDGAISNSSDDSVESHISLMEQLDYSSFHNYGDPNESVVYDNNPGSSPMEDDTDMNGQQSSSMHDEQETESDCEIIGVVPNQQGAVMNTRVVPCAPRAPIVELYDRLCDLAALTNDIASYVSRPHGSARHREGVDQLQSRSIAAHLVGEIMNDEQGGTDSSYGLFDESGSDMPSMSTSNTGHSDTRSRDADSGIRGRGINTPNQNEEDDDIIVGPMFWGPPITQPPPVRSYPKPKPVLSCYNIIEENNNGSEVESVLEDVEFLFRCPICYSTIARFKSSKVPNDNDRVIYSTKCGHMYCFECIEGVRKRRECSICRKPLRDSKQYHVIYP